MFGRREIIERVCRIPDSLRLEIADSIADSKNLVLEIPLLEEVIRCKDCVHAEAVACLPDLYVCKSNCDVWGPEGFCSHGERKKSDA